MIPHPVRGPGPRGTAFLTPRPVRSACGKGIPWPPGRGLPPSGIPESPVIGEVRGGRGSSWGFDGRELGETGAGGPPTRPGICRGAQVCDRPLATVPQRPPFRRHWYAGPPKPNGGPRHMWPPGEVGAAHTSVLGPPLCGLGGVASGQALGGAHGTTALGGFRGLWRPRRTGGGILGPSRNE